MEILVKIVVICSKFPTFVVESTTDESKEMTRCCCDLLEISYLCGRINNLPSSSIVAIEVVICSKFPTFVVESTTYNCYDISCLCCDLLEISYLCGRINNRQIHQGCKLML